MIQVASGSLPAAIDAALALPTQMKALGLSLGGVGAQLVGQVVDLGALLEDHAAPARQRAGLTHASSVIRRQIERGAVGDLDRARCCR